MTVDELLSTPCEPQPIVHLVDPDGPRRRLVAEEMEALGAVVHAGPRAEADPRRGTVHVVIISVLSRSASPAEVVPPARTVANTLGVPLLALLRSGDREGIGEALAAGADDVLTWPVDRAQLRARLQTMASVGQLRAEVSQFGRVLNSLVHTLEARIPYTEGRSERVGEIASALAREVGLCSRDAQQIRQAAWIHNLGEVILPEHVFSGQKLTADDEARLRAHPRTGYELLEGLPSLEPLLPFLLLHHERIDGSGYPNGLVGDDIPLPVQALSLADAYDALTSPRPYRPARTHEAALEILGKEAARGAWAAPLLSALARIAGGGDLDDADDAGLDLNAPLC